MFSVNLLTEASNPNKTNTVKSVIEDTIKEYNFWSLRSSWSIALRPCSNYIFILDLILDFNGMGIDSCKTRWETVKVWDLVATYNRDLTVDEKNPCIQTELQIIAKMLLIVSYAMR